jgi:hypothetical protein
VLVAALGAVEGVLQPVQEQRPVGQAREWVGERLDAWRIVSTVLAAARARLACSANAVSISRSAWS